MGPIVHRLSGLFAALMLVSQPAAAELDEGAYLAGRQAAAQSDFQAAASYFTQGLLSDPGNALLLDSALSAYLSLGQFERAVPLAENMTERGFTGQISHLVQMADAAAREDWTAIFSHLENGRMVSPLVDGLMQSWAALGQGRTDQALASFDEVAEGQGMRRFGLYHKALALAVLGDYPAAEATFAEGLSTGGIVNGRAALAHAQVLSQMGRNTDAEQLLAATFGATQAPEVLDAQARLATGETLEFDIVTTPREGVAEAVFMVSRLVVGEMPDQYALMLVRVALHLHPEHIDAMILAAELLEDLGRYDLANDTYAAVPADEPAYLAAELGRITVLQRDDRADAAIEAATALARSYPDHPIVHSKLGDVLRIERELEDARRAYSHALDILPEDANGAPRLHYVRAITSFYLDDWPAAEEDFRASLALQPDNANVLNFLGYSLVERGEKLEEALDMIERAVAQQPDNGAIVDSLGWALYKLGRFDDAVGYMERAASLEPVDPVINDHLGDVYWSVGRQIEAQFQWHRALSFDPEDDLAERIRRKLEVGLDQVLADEGAEPIDLANDTR